ncbi:DMT family transporter [Pseudonocardiaceae bacterium YIM PH 21723]|nr:DMT family transporter [Pseudonocardiaceae bacterium YIM PH 21723]
MNNPASWYRLALCALFWGSSFVWIKYALAGLSPQQISWVRIGLGAAVLLAFVLVGGHRLPRKPKVWLHLGVVAILWNVIPFTLFAVGERTIDSSLAGVLNATTPLWTLLIALAIGVEKRLTGRRLGGLLIGFVGTLLIFQPWHASQALSWGALACTIAAICYAIALNYVTKALGGEGLDPIVLAGSQMMLAFVIGTLLLPVADGFTPVHLSPLVIGSMVILGVFGTGLAFRFNFQTMADEGPVTASIVTYLMPPVSVLLGAVLLHEQLNWSALLGTAVVLAGTALSRKPTPKPAPVAEPAMA